MTDTDAPALASLLATLPPGQRRVAEALIGPASAPTYRGVAEVLGLTPGTVHQHLRRIRVQRPDVYELLMQVRAQQLADRHMAALERALAQSDRWQRRLSGRRFRLRFGHYPWDRP
jgi:hypothetical protein